jgi:F420-non-reducing hydrogenase small subunit
MLKLAIVPGAICGGCDVALASLGETLTEILKYYEIVYWPLVIDKKLSDLMKLESIDVLIFHGLITTEEDAKLAKDLSSRARVKVALGTCSVYGGIPGLNSFYKPEEIIKTVASIPETRLEGDSLNLPRLVHYSAYTDIVEPDILAPGCPPTDNVLEQLVNLLLSYAKTGKLEARPILLGDPESLCNKCPRNPKTTKIVMPGIKRLYEVKPDPNKCFLEQGILCMGPATRAICAHPCIKFNHPCIGCGGPVEWGADHGLSMISAAASILMVDKEKVVLEPGLSKELDKIQDVIGTFYRYTFRKSKPYILRSRIIGVKEL